ncbi:MAG TPA: carboxymuconolactone decarboxylase family protein [Sandaracinaceae bacterium LLY-WYZ-13_1]|nr:carboxymuconolactone decarboxylase family protein [Sandaracinaceae bacterium LLY-WYZ-13_1]
MSQPEDARPPAHYRTFVKDHPEVAQAYQALGKAVRKAGPLTDREVMLVKLALAVGAQHEGATHAHVRKARAGDVEDAAIRQVAVLGIPTLGFPSAMAALTWMNDALGSEEDR